MYISKGVLKAFPDDQELAAVIAHQVAHAGFPGKFRDGARWSERGCQVRAALDSGSGPWVPESLHSADELAEEITVDSRAIELMAREGYDVGAYARAIAKLEQEPLWSTEHPDSSERREAMAVGMLIRVAH